jgi:DNA-3-methyladenine glycosylase I
MADEELEKILLDPGIVRNRLKIYSVRKNARVTLDIISLFGSLDEYFWSYVDHKSIMSYSKSLSEVPAETEISKTISKDLKRRGMSFVGSTIIYAFMQAVGMVDDHIEGCFRKS